MPDNVEHKMATKRLSINLPADVFDELRDLAESRQRSMTDLVRDSFALAKVAYQELGSGNRLAVTNESGKLLKEIVLIR
jgi:hypothetical protein